MREVLGTGTKIGIVSSIPFWDLVYTTQALVYLSFISLPVYFILD